LRPAGDILRAIRALPHGTVDQILRDETPIILAPHPDDEVIGCGALIAASALAGRAPVIVYITDGSGSHPNSRLFPRPALIALRQHEGRLASRVLGVASTRVHFLGVRDTATPQDGPELAAAAQTIIETIRHYPNPVVFAPWINDPHGDHQSVSKMATLVCRILMARHLSYVVWGWTLPDDLPIEGEIAGCRFPVDRERQRKSRALQAYQSQISDLIDDDPAGFRLDAETLELMLSEVETFLVNP
jgi:LmbE family N-acetylglucosaminyl deacetylase